MRPTDGDGRLELVGSCIFVRPLVEFTLSELPESNLLRKLTNELRKTRNCRSAKVYFQYRHLYHSRTRSRLFKR